MDNPITQWFQKQALELDIELGDVLLGGRFKNVPMTVEEIGTDELGQPTVNGRKLLAYRIKKNMPQKTAALLAGLALCKRASVAEAAKDADPNPSEAQIAAENYEHGHARLHGMGISIENAKGAVRSGTDPDGKEWSVTMPATYGYVLGTEGEDGDNLDCYVGPDEACERVFVVDQLDPDSGDFDEHKVFFGFDSEAAVKECYDAGFSDGSGPSRRATVTEIALPTFKAWAFSKRVKGPFAALPSEKEASQAAVSRRIEQDSYDRNFAGRCAYHLKQAAAEPKQPETYLLAKPDSRTRTAVLKMHESLAPDDILELEHDPHVTVMGRITKGNWSEMRDLMEGMEPGSIMLGEPTVFDNPDSDVLKLPVLYRGGLPAMHDFLRQNTQNKWSWPEYRPHITIAYLKKGTGKKYTGKPLPPELQDMIPLRNVVYSREGKHIPILRGNAG